MYKTISNIIEEKYVVEDQERVEIKDSNITKLVVKKGVRDIICKNIGLHELDINDGTDLEFINCSCNFLNTLSVPKSVVAVNADNNSICDFKICQNNDNLMRLHVRQNKIENIEYDFPEDFYHLDIEGNPPIKFKSASWIYKLRESPSTCFCGGDWRYKRPFTQLELECLWHIMHKPIII